MKEVKRRKAVEKVLEEIEVKAEIVEVWRAERGASEGKEMVGVRLAKKEQKKKVLRKKGALRGRKERISKDSTWKKRKMKWRLKKIAREEERKGNRT